MLFSTEASEDASVRLEEMTMQPVLVIDDDVGLCELVAEYLEPEGYKVEAVHDGEAGVRRALSGEHALAVLDFMLPGINGFEVLRRIRASSQLPVVMLTARAGQERAGREGAETIVVGDVEMDGNTRTVRRAGQPVELTVVEYSLLEKL